MAEVAAASAAAWSIDSTRMSLAAGPALLMRAKPPDEMRMIQARYSQNAFVLIISGRV